MASISIKRVIGMDVGKIDLAYNRSEPTQRVKEEL
ncbi:hypothetical protein HKBW3S03_01171 [Candidatus Hakubella thermalkaliphila]|uniref:Uncharacterized protein n=1 Tax=Candidatus Hakubella thermalkaliphila TaxID=2754717 RepID=A0A6V8NME3_9ACTN|nr:hypothetical protein HKBW3S03_01171 [Candidatus Hakubella thermalkaliphila]GFP23581.1 hypothetical protein HKBW3S09_01046 [Candidatus Hakubella thermalkaliphila]GFP37560.1 hypothetical protein HKBW3S44_01238 [Candidatus Hakubella thermalkaliphila]GFP39738.1 hypothetical protein HKBW3S47_01436 [Candidatus Hakubella thermalkaliphila]GFP43054.1 hypothetical protein HKBW3C_02186 [Candidatus Hakubella thermalkaliphila]